MRKTQQTSVKVMVRMRPPASPQVQCEGEFNNQIRLEKRLYTFDHVFGPQATDDDLFGKVGNQLIFNTLEGMNSCLFVYGQTGTGKTYTMTGNAVREGLTQRTFRQLWHRLETTPAVQNFTVKTSYIEIYNEEIKDLLADGASGGSLPVREHAKLGFFIEGMRELQMEGERQIEQVVRRGAKNRTVKFTKMNETSSRSHTILTVVVECKVEQEGGVLIRSAKLNFVDLAGCEKQKQTGVEGESLKEASNINKSLSCLTRVISQLSEVKPSSRQSVHIPFRNSVLTMLLKDSLSGNSRTIIVGTISSNPAWAQETIGTLTFLEKAKKIKTEIQVNEKTQGNEELLKKKLSSFEEKFTEMKGEIMRLQGQMQEAKVSEEKKDIEIEKLRALLLTCEQPLTIFDIFQDTPNPAAPTSQDDSLSQATKDQMLQTITEQNEQSLYESEAYATEKKGKKTTRSECVGNTRYPASQQLPSYSNQEQQPKEGPLDSLLKMENQFLKAQTEKYFQEETKFAELLGLVEKNLQNLQFRDAELLVLQVQAEKLQTVEAHLRSSNEHRERLVREAELMQSKFRAEIRGARSIELDNISVRSSMQSAENRILRENEKLREEKEKLREEMEQMEERFRQKDMEFKAKLYEIIQEIEAERNKCTQANLEIQRLNAVIQAQEIQSQSLSKSLSNSKQSFNSELQEKMSKLERKNRQLEEDIEELLCSSALNNLLQTISEKQKEIERLATVLKDREDEIQQLNQGVEAEMGRTAELEQSLQSKCNQMEELNARIFLLENELDLQEEEQSLLEKELLSKDETLQSFKQDLFQLKEAHSKSKGKAETQLNVKIQQINTLNQKNDEMKGTLDWNKVKIALLNKSIAEHLEKITQMTAKITELQDKIVHLEAANQQLIGQLEPLQSDLTSKTNLIFTLESQIHTLKLSPEIKIQINDEILTVPELISRHEEALQAIALSKEEVSFLQGRCNQLQQEKELFSSKEQFAEEREKVLQNEVRTLMREVDSLKKDVLGINQISKMVELAEESQRKVSRHGERDKHTAELNRKYQAERERSEHYKAMLSEMKEGFMSQFAMMEKTNTELARRGDELVAEKQETQRQRDEMGLEMKKLQHERKKLEQMVSDLKAQVRELKANVEKGRTQPQGAMLGELRQKLEEMEAVVRGGKKLQGEDPFFLFRHMLVEMELKNQKMEAEAENSRNKAEISRLCSLLRMNKIKY